MTWIMVGGFGVVMIGRHRGLGRLENVLMFGDASFHIFVDDVLTSCDAFVIGTTIVGSEGFPNVVFERRVTNSRFGFVVELDDVVLRILLVRPSWLGRRARRGIRLDSRVRRHRGRKASCLKTRFLLAMSPVDLGFHGRLGEFGINTRKLGEIRSEDVESGIVERYIRTMVRKIVTASKRVVFLFLSVRGSVNGNRVWSRRRMVEGRSYHVRMRVRAIREFHLHGTDVSTVGVIRSLDETGVA